MKLASSALDGIFNFTPQSILPSSFFLLPLLPTKHHHHHHLGLGRRRRRRRHPGSKGGKGKGCVWVVCVCAQGVEKRKEGNPFSPTLDGNRRHISETIIYLKSRISLLINFNSIQIKRKLRKCIIWRFSIISVMRSPSGEGICQRSSLSNLIRRRRGNKEDRTKKALRHRCGRNRCLSKLHINHVCCSCCCSFRVGGWVAAAFIFQKIVAVTAAWVLIKRFFFLLRWLRWWLRLWGAFIFS